ncbi:MAG: lipocalin family protein [Acidobacteria bacterium]|nr:lipocalin family protein [Acidobacteriota bacterium]
MALISIALCGFAVAQQNKQAALTTVGSVDIPKYLGKWYEIAKYPNKFQKQCVGNTTATYSQKANGKLEVLNECLKKDGTTDAAKADGKIADKASNAKLKVRFAPGFLSFLPFVWADYWIIDLDRDYEYAVVGEPKREYLWILSRKPTIDEALYQQILSRIESKGFVPTRLVKTPQNMTTVRGAAVEKQNL